MACSRQKKTEVLARGDRLWELIEQDAPTLLLGAALGEIGGSLDGLARARRAEGESSTGAAEWEAPPAL